MSESMRDEIPTGNFENVWDGKDFAEMTQTEEMWLLLGKESDGQTRST